MANPTDTFKDFVKLHFASALRETFRKGYSFALFQKDLMAGVVVALVAIPLGMALAIASGVSPQAGLYTVIFGGILVALLGGAKLQIAGPTSAFVVILLPIAQKYGFSGLLVSGMMAGLFLILMGFLGFGRFIRYIPYPVTTGFTAGIGLVIAILQFKDLLGLSFTNQPNGIVGIVSSTVTALPTYQWHELTVGFVSLIFLIAWGKLKSRLPAPLVVLVVMTAVAYILENYFGFSVVTLGERFQSIINGTKYNGIPNILPQLIAPWKLPETGSAHIGLDFETVRELLPSALAIAVLGAIETLLTATVADGMAQTKHDPDAELFAMGVANFVTPFFGGIPVSGGISRTATNVRFGAVSPISAIVHSLFTLFTILILAPFMSMLPVATLAALLIVVAYNMSNITSFKHVLDVGQRSDIVVLIGCFVLTVVFDMIVGVTFGVISAALLFMRRMEQITSTSVSGVTSAHPQHLNLPKDILYYEIEGPLFFGATEKAMSTLNAMSTRFRAVIFNLEKVPVIDVTGLVAFENTLVRLRNQKKTIYLVCVNDQPFEMLLRTGLIDSSHIFIVSTLDEASTRARAMTEAIKVSQ